ncbi:hypothetical protein NAL32_16380 [Chryseobacterium sp. Ch-15]|uniref:Uncharacterized protein n=1 Tax=Chryseobacterium muglaense TaxID=2893752 RepID=A0A9Q3V0A5_9FLAO|nr:hypothetical protein [Chryseobacterium muglaense]MBD3906246.1 hypothetical protein [Chryseobacterium muglaense]MCC9036781.1 hypothetical protein [Chryseobacterium muglaense]MCM2555962.1 hypothetical protein [Chryseobacterium muglaense]
MNAQHSYRFMKNKPMPSVFPNIGRDKWELFGTAPPVAQSKKNQIAEIQRRVFLKFF